MARWRLVVALLLLAMYVIVPGIMGLARASGDTAVLPPTVQGVIILSFWELGLFAVAFLLAAWLGGIRSEQLLLRWRGGWWVLPRALGWSVLLRIAVGIILAAVLVAWSLVRGVSVENLEGVRPQVESMLDVNALSNPIYFILMLTLVSFVLAGLREELWRVGMLALLAKLSPKWFGGRLGPWLAILPVALLFGLGHTSQGPGGVALTTLLGVGLGCVMLFHRSLWDAVLAHGFFNAATFAILPWVAENYPDLLRG